MAVVINRTTKQINRSAHTPAFPTAQWVVYNKDFAKIAALDTLLASVPARHIKFDGSDNPQEMTAGEKRTEDRTVQTIVLRSNGVADFDGVPVVRATNQHTITIEKFDQGRNLVNVGTEALKVDLSARIPVSTNSPTLAAGTATFTVGPLSAGEVSDVIVTVSDPAGNLNTVPLTIRFR